MIGIAIGVVATLLVRHRSTSTDCVTQPTAPSAAPALGSAARAAELATPHAHTTDVERDQDVDVRRQPDADHGMSTSDEWWAKLPLRPNWDAALKTSTLERLSKYLGIKLDPSKVECRTRCCRVTVSDEVYDAHSEELGSTVGLRFAPSDGYGTHRTKDRGTVITTCFATDAPKVAMPDRGAERDAMIAKAADAIRKCGVGLAHPMTLKLTLWLDEGGQITKVDSNKAQLGSPAGTCAETALLTAAAFAPAPMTSDVPVSVVIGKG